MKNQHKTIGLKAFSRNFTPEQRKIVEEEINYYDLLTSFKEAREKRGITQEELATKANVNRTTLSKIESGLRNATIETLSKLASAMDMQLEVKLKIV
ncbi:MAG: hypothetical protein COY81_04485 [Candidatus Pacebacteria bacterium CG_4_10_14_0_8_um_filter_43_12]|uniref:HTH cro/C1-type domain-containing protein n=1 Tax=Candidatus Roizmanbacteria bacterium CG_4_10_14_0_2_um_filter_39_13 TaxID=1974825 RepID=A0A2M7TZG2_9BACT|nr:MAG: hypothetical protein COU66_00495 [Candidatus Pacebacteria bacterium CG10_big_fil_rev_8_21_14_0_10_44_11]PIY79143.1 MAG: hypothetical protein COY81_04485 [Candidatus Pacebacteria bacterium CG_4_10_14_0_8_um_filter_43_12]PIZ63032.1 MAG: hypothetical protein COY16_02920 [Candidatus Roizmanbacteria bacterium CG_4_10_14_0_2_um_filter_39_13]